MMIHVDVDDDNDDITDTAIYKSMNIKYKCFMYVHTVSDYDYVLFTSPSLLPFFTVFALSSSQLTN